LWRAHIERALRAAKTLRAGRPSPRLATRDPYALRGLVVVALIASFFIAGSDRMRRIYAAFNWQGVMAPANFRIDAWVNPPNYTGKPPVVLAAMRPGEPVPQSAGTVTVPSGSTLIIRASGQVSLDVAMTGGIEDAKNVEAKSADKTASTPAATKVVDKSADRGGADERRLVITEAGTVTLRSAVANDIVWRFTAIPDRAPTIALTKDPEPQQRGALQLTYKLEDDYGVVGAQAQSKLKDGYKGTNGEPPRNLFDAPDVSLALPQARTKNGVGQTTK